MQSIHSSATIGAQMNGNRIEATREGKIASIWVKRGSNLPFWIARMVLHGECEKALLSFDKKLSQGSGYRHVPATPGSNLSARSLHMARARRLDLDVLYMRPTLQFYIFCISLQSIGCYIAYFQRRKYSGKPSVIIEVKALV